LRWPPGRRDQRPLTSKRTPQTRAISARSVPTVRVSVIGAVLPSGPPGCFGGPSLQRVALAAWPSIQAGRCSLDDATGSAILLRQERPVLRQAVTLDPRVVASPDRRDRGGRHRARSPAHTMRDAAHEFTLAGRMEAARVKDYRDELSRFKLRCRWPPSPGSRLRCC
jgi:hypothetical protein